MKARAVILATTAAASALLLTGCSAQVDITATGAAKVPGTTDLYRFCDGTTLIYFTNRDATKDEYEFVIYDGCSADPNAQPRVAGE